MENKYLIDYYSNYDEDSRLDHKEKQIEFLTTQIYLDNYLETGMKILELGAGTGKYSLHYSRAGYDVTALELVQHNIDVLKSKLTIFDKLDIQQGTALDLSRFEDNTFDVTLVLGPMYHVYNDEAKNKCIDEALRVTKSGGLIYIAYISHDAVIVNWGLIHKQLTKKNKEKHITKDYKFIATPEEIFSMFHVDEFNDLMSQKDIEHLHTVATDGIAPHLKYAFKDLPDEVYQEWLKYHFKTCERKDLIGHSNHILYIGRKL